MLEIYHAVILALIQGLTEFLPVSSSAHLILVPKLLKWQDQGIAFDVAVHLGTLLAVVVYFRVEIALMIENWRKSLTSKRLNPDSRLAWGILIATIPAAIFGLLMHDYIATVLRATWVIAATTLGFGIILGFASAIAKQQRDEYHITWKDILIIGFAQAISLIPGVSRSGITLTAGLFVGLTRKAAARFSFLLSIPIIILAGGLETLKMVNTPQQINYFAVITGFSVAALSGYACIDVFLKLLERYGVMPFVIYRVLLGITLLFLL